MGVSEVIIALCPLYKPVQATKPVYLLTEWLEAEQSYKDALGLCPVCFSKERAVLFSNRAAARLHLVINS